MRKIYYLFFPVFLLSSLHARENPRFEQHQREIPSVQECYSLVLESYQNKNWNKVIEQAFLLLEEYPTTAFAQDVLFYLAVSYFELEEYERANHYFSSYLKKQMTPKFFEETFMYKFKIAEKYRTGTKKAILGLKWIPARQEALDIYEELISTLPNHELTAQSLFAKAELLAKGKDYKESIETYQNLIQQFPKHFLAIRSYVEIGRVYLIQSQKEYANQDFLELATINLHRVSASFPSDEAVHEIEDMLLDMQEVYAKDLYEIALFYHRKNQPNAAYLYYKRILTTYPATVIAKKAEKKMADLHLSAQEENHA